MGSQPSKLALALNRAISSYQAGQLIEAEKICQKIIATKRNLFDPNHVLAVVQAALGKHELALASYNRALAVQPNHADALNNRGNTLKELGRLDEALASYNRALTAQPNNAGALNNRGVTLLLLKRLDEAVASFERAATLRPDYAEAHYNRGNALYELKRYDEALASYDRTLALRPNVSGVLCNRGNALRALKRFDEAIASYDRALVLQPDLVEAHTSRGAVLAELKRFDDAVAAYDRALALRPGDVAAANSRGVILYEMKRYDEALASFDRALALLPDYAEAHYNRGNVLHDMKRYDEALASYERALAVRTDHGETWNNRSKVLTELDRYDEALTSAERAVALGPDNVTAHCNEASLRLITGDLGRGLVEYEWRWKKADMAPVRRDFAQPLWLGADDIAGKTILLHCEQGFGDTIQFCRYAPLVAARGANVILEVQEPLRALMATLAGPSQVIAKGSPLPDFDVHCPVLSLPLACGTRLETVPSDTPYLHASPNLSAAWDACLGPKARPRVGLVWTGNAAQERDHLRSIGLRKLLPLLNVDATFVSLHRDVRPDDMAVLEERDDILHFGEALGDFADTAALISQLDLVISVCTSVAHLTGALHKPVWVLLGRVPDWRWLLEREDNPWYPTARLFRQDATRNWDSVVTRVHGALREFVESGSHG